MGLLDRFKKDKTADAPKMLVIGLDGTPYSYIKKRTDAGELPNFKRVLDTGSFRPLKSVIPTVSCVAWSSVMTGHNPARHNIFGFIDRKPGTYDIYLPNGATLRSKLMVEEMSTAGKKVVSLSVPVTYPPRQIRGALVSGFLAPKIDKATFPPQLASDLKSMGYIIDIDPWLARENLEKFFPSLMETMQKRIEAVRFLRERYNPDFMIAHFMSTDRLHHFMWEHMEEGREPFAGQFIEFYDTIDRFLGEILDGLDKNTRLMMLSDHGFCTLKKEYYPNYWLRDNGYMTIDAEKPKSPLDFNPAATKAYCMDPGRIYLNVKGREPGGIVEPGEEYESLRNELREKLAGMTDPESGDPMVKRVYTREELYDGPEYDRSPDLVIDPVNGYDPKGKLKPESLTFKGTLVGMHTYDDAMLFIQDEEIKAEDISVVDVMPTIFKMMKLDIPAGLDGAPVI